MSEKKFKFPGCSRPITREEWLAVSDNTSEPARTCPICGRRLLEKYSEKHHLVPRCKKGKELIILCVDCARQIHQIFSISELTHTYNTLESLLSHPKIREWGKWAHNKNFGICMKSKKRKR